jgi:hypothetical protein
MRLRMTLLRGSQGVVRNALTFFGGGIEGFRFLRQEDSTPRKGG